MQTLTLAIDGMSCGHCVARVERALASVPGVRLASVAVGEARVEIDPRLATAEGLAAKLAELGYPTRVAEVKP